MSTRPAPRAWTIAPEVSHYRYKEPGVMTNEGTLYGVVGSYTFHNLGDDDFSLPGANGDDLNSWSAIRIEGRLGFGEVDYDGSFMDGTPLSTSGTDDLLIDVRLLWGREWQPARCVHAAYVGLGYRYLNDDSSEQLGGYERESNYLYIPLGARRDFDLAGRWDLGLTGDFDVLIVGRQISHLDDADPALPTVRNWQWPGFGAAVSVELGVAAVPHPANMTAKMRRTIGRNLRRRMLILLSLCVLRGSQAPHESHLVLLVGASDLLSSLAHGQGDENCVGGRIQCWAGNLG